MKDSMEEWKEYKLDQLVELKNGVAFKSNEFIEKGIPVIKIKNVKPNRILLNDLSFVSEESAINKKSFFILPSDILITMTGNRKDGGADSWVGKVALFNHQGRFLLNQRVSAIRVKDNSLVDFKYLSYLLSGWEAQLYFVNHSNSSGGQANISPDVVCNYSVSLPPLPEQHRIVSILSSLDSKIEINRRINANLEQQAQALFKSWFVDFEPFKNGEFVESELGRIPKGWRVGTLGDICKQSSVKVGSRTDVKVLSPITTGNLMLSEEYFTKQVFSESIAKYKVVKKRAFAYNPARVNIGSLGRNEFDFEGAVSPVYVVFECKEGYANYFDLYRGTERFKTEVLLRAIGGVRQSLNYTDFAMIQSIIAPQEVVEAFNPMFETIKENQKHFNKENERLSTLRDTLLPRLMSGELHVKDIERSAI